MSKKGRAKTRAIAIVAFVPLERVAENVIIQTARGGMRVSGQGRCANQRVAKTRPCGRYLHRTEWHLPLARETSRPSSFFFPAAPSEPSSATRDTWLEERQVGRHAVFLVIDGDNCVKSHSLPGRTERRGCGRTPSEASPGYAVTGIGFGGKRSGSVVQKNRGRIGFRGNRSGPAVRESDQIRFGAESDSVVHHFDFFPQIPIDRVDSR